jgi:glycosyltransferase involved in cell wall biosynthesis
MIIGIICPLWGHFGGREEYLIEVVEELTKRGHSCFVIYGQLTGRPPKIQTAAKIRTYSVPSVSVFKSSRDRSKAAAFQRIIAAEKPNILLVHDIKNFSILRLVRDFRKSIAVFHYGWLFCLRNVRILYSSRKACYRRLGMACLGHGCFVRKNDMPTGSRLCYNSLRDLKKLIRLYRRFDHLIVTSHYMRDLFVQHGFQESRLEILGLFPRDGIAADVSPEFTRPHILFIGRIDRYKGLDFLLKALAKIQSPFICQIIGEGPFLPRCRELSRRLGISPRVEFLGWLSRESIRPYLEKARLVVVPSLMPEAFGLVGLESLAFGKPVVAFDNGGIADWLRDGHNGYLVPSKDTVNLADRIDRLLRNPELAQELGERGLRVVEKTFNRELHISRLIRTMEQLSTRPEDTLDGDRRSFGSLIS